MKKVRDIFRKKGFRKGLPRFMNCLSARFSAGRGQDGRTRLFSRLNKIFSTAGSGARGMRPGRSGLSSATSKKFGRAVPLQIGGSHPCALSPRRWGKQKGRSEQSNCKGCFLFSPATPKFFGRAARRVPSPSGRSMIEMLAVLAIIGVLSIAALVGFTYAMNKHRANETIYDVMLRGTNVPMVDENYASKPSGHEFRFPGLVNNGRQGTYYPMTTKKDAGSSYYVEATGVTYRVCELILKMNPTDIDQIVVNNSVYTGDSDICGTTDGLAMKFCFGSDGTICDGTGHGASSGGSSGGTSGGSGSGSEPDPEPDPDPCSLSKDCTGAMVCINGFCQDPNPNEPCSTDADCVGDQTCTNSICEKPETCTTSADCDGNLTCTEDGECKNPEPCSTDTDCPGEQICTEGTCTDPVLCTSDENCPTGQICMEGICYDPCPYEDKPYIDPDSPTYTCVECLTDAHCADRTDGKTSCDPTNKVCQQSGCTSNDDCETGYFCAFQNASGCSDKDKGTGECKLISLCGIGDPIQSFFYSEVGMTWWSAQNWCAAQGATLATRESVGCPDETYRCTSDILTSFKSWNKTYGAWLEKKDDDCKAYYMRLYGGDMFTGTRHGGWGVALCHG